ncbi:MAG: hypothetical protein JNK72_03725 [Myxococcales bacterium]|nr:hypothetical protein [Myxococcales bacterium]
MRFTGIAPERLVEQVENTAAWALSGPTEGLRYSWRRRLVAGRGCAQSYDDPQGYFGLQLAAHFCTVGTFVPTDVDSHIRHHAWQRCEDAETLARFVAVVDETDHWETASVSARCITVPEVGALSGHEGEWLAVRAGALGRALQLEGAEALVEQLLAQIEAVITRSHRAWALCEGRPGRELLALQVATTVAHNLGDLARVVEAWKVSSERGRALQRALTRPAREVQGDPRFERMGRINTEIMAAENGRFLPLREARPLRLGRSLLLGLGPNLDAWGATLARDPLLDEEGPAGMLGGRGAVLAALVKGHLAQPAVLAWVRAIAGFHHAHPGGVEALADKVAARDRKALSAGPVREAFGVSPERFMARLVNRYQTALKR